MSARLPCAPLGALVACIACVALVVTPAGAQQCAVAWPGGPLAAIAGARVGTVRIVRQPPLLPAGTERLLRGLHARTREGTVRRELLLAPGDTLDTLRLAETVRRLRRVRWLADAGIEVARCEGDGALAVTVTTRDAWSTVPTARWRGGSGAAVVGLEERNLFGSGRGGSVSLRAEGGRLGVGIGYVDPWVLGSAASLSASRTAFTDGERWGARLEHRRHSVFDRWDAGVSAARVSRAPPRPDGDRVTRQSLEALAGRRVLATSAGALRLRAGVEWDQATAAAGAGAAIVGPARVRRDYRGVAVGLVRQSAWLDTLSWLLPDGQLADLPLGTEADVVAGIGRDVAEGRAARHLDAWVGRMARPSPRLLVVGDAWASGFSAGGGWSAAALRVAVAAYRGAPRGFWEARIGAERLEDPDPDVRALSSTDLALRVFPASGRLAEGAAVAALERRVHLRALGHGYWLDGALFSTAAAHWSPSGEGPDRLAAVIVGGGVQLAPMRLGRSTLRLDVGVPVLRTPGVRGRPFVGISVAPWIEAGRRRARATGEP